MKTSLNEEVLGGLSERLIKAHHALIQRYPEGQWGRRPVHTVYGGAHLFTAEAARKLGKLALRAMDDHAPDFALLSRAIHLAGSDDRRVAIYDRIRAKLRAEPVEDYRIDFEDGYGVRPPDEEDRHAKIAAAEVAKGIAIGSLPPFLGIRIKPLTEELWARSVRTLDLFFTSLCSTTRGAVPANFVVTLPKITVPEQVEALAAVLDELEPALGIAKGTIKIELMIETPQALFDADGRVPLRKLVLAAGGRCSGAHLGAYDFTAALGIAANEQRLSHPVCDFARDIMLSALAGSGIALSDGATNVLPVPIHKPSAGPLSEAERSENREAVHTAWRLHYHDVRRALSRGLYQGWDLHPAQLVTRYAALYDFFLGGLHDAALRLRRLVEGAAKATLVGSVFDDAATGQGLLNYFLRAIACGALTEEEAQARSELTLAELRGRSFSAIASGRAAPATI